MRLVERRRRTAATGDEDEFRRQVGQLRVGVVVIPDHGAVAEADLQQIPELPDVALGLRALLLLERVVAARRDAGLARRRDAGIADREGILEDRGGDAPAYRIDEVVELVLRQRRRLHDEQCVVVFDPHRSIDLLRLVLLVELPDDLLGGSAGHRLYVETAEESRIRIHHADTPALLLAHRRDGTHHLVLDGNAPVEERNNDLVQAAHERGAEKDLLHLELAARRGLHRPGGDAELLLRLDRVPAEDVRVMDPNDHAVARERVHFAQHVEQVGPHLHVRLGHLRADVGIDVDRALVVEHAEQADRLRAKTTEPLAGGVHAAIETRGQYRQPRGHRQQGQHPQRVVKSLGNRGTPAGPEPPADEHHADI